MTRRDGAFEGLTAGALAETFYRMKSLRRAGWVRRGLADVESLADHSFGALLLALLYLPEKGPGRYDKGRILRMLLVHDLAEVFTGDIPSPEKRPSHERQERECFERIGALGRLEGVADLRWVPRLFAEFERGKTVNARIARDLDKLDNLVQLHVYGRRGDSIEDFAPWRERLRARVMSREGRRIRDLVDGHFTALPEARLPKGPSRVKGKGHGSSDPHRR